MTNLHRRHLTPSQCAMVGADLATMRQGARTDLRQPSASLPEVSQAQAARLSTASERGVRSAVFVKKKGSHDLVQAVRAGKITVNLAAKLATASEETQRRAVAEPDRAHVLVKQAARAERESELAAKQLALPAKRFGVIYADPPWRFEVYSRDTGLDRDASNHYPVQALEKIKTLDVASIAASDCVLFLWATAPMLPEALEVMAAWGFEYRSELRLGEGPRRDRLLEAQSARAPSRRRQGRRPGACPGRAVGEPDPGGCPRAFPQARRGEADDRGLLPDPAEDRAVRPRRGKAGVGCVGERGGVTC